MLSSTHRRRRGESSDSPPRKFRCITSKSPACIFAVRVVLYNCSKGRCGRARRSRDSPERVRPTRVSKSVPDEPAARRKLLVVRDTRWRAAGWRGAPFKCVANTCCLLESRDSPSDRHPYPRERAKGKRVSIGRNPRLTGPGFSSATKLDVIHPKVGADVLTPYVHHSRCIVASRSDRGIDSTHGGSYYGAYHQREVRSHQLGATQPQPEDLPVPAHPREGGNRACPRERVESRMRVTRASGRGLAARLPRALPHLTR